MPVAAPADGRPLLHDRRALSYAHGVPPGWRRAAVRALEWATAKPAVIARVRRFERQGSPGGAAFWEGLLDAAGVDLATPAAEVARVPASGPVVMVANHPHGLVDGLALAALAGRARPDWRLLSRAHLADLDPEAGARLIAVPFAGEADAQGRMVAMRALALAHLRQGGLVALFPSGVVAEAARLGGPAVEGEWHAFTAKLIRVSGAAVVPVRFEGANGPAYQAAARLSPTLRQGLMLLEARRAMDRPQAPVVGPPVPRAEMEARWDDPRAFMAWLRARTLSLRR